MSKPNSLRVDVSPVSADLPSTPEVSRAVYFIEEFCRYAEGRQRGRRITLLPWQKRLIAHTLGCRRENGRRRYAFSWLEAPSRSGKTTLAAALALYMLLVDEEPAARIFVVSGTAPGTGHCFKMAKAMIALDTDLAEVCETTTNEICYKGSKIINITGHTRNIPNCPASCVIFDDVQALKSHEQHDVILRRIGETANPSVFYFCSASDSHFNLAWELHQYVTSLLDQAPEQSGWWIQIHGASPSDDWASPATWQKAHPGLGVTLLESFLQSECRRAQAIPSFAQLFCRRYLNIWLTNQARWIDIEAWDRCARPPAEADALRGRSCIVGLDLSTTNDLSAVVAVFPEAETGYTVLPFAFCPDEAIATRSRRDRVNYARWRDEGAIITSPGNIIDQNQILQKILELQNDYSVVELAYDRWNASMLVSCLRANRLTCVPVPQTISFLNIAARELESALASGRLIHFGHPVLKWCVSNAVIEMNSAGEIKPAKHKSRERIDLLLAMLFAMARICLRRR